MGTDEVGTVLGGKLLWVKNPANVVQTSSPKNVHLSHTGDNFQASRRVHKNV